MLQFKLPGALSQPETPTNSRLLYKIIFPLHLKTSHQGMDLQSIETLSEVSSNSSVCDLMEQPKSAGSDIMDTINESKNRNKMMRSHFGDKLPQDQVCVAGSNY